MNTPWNVKAKARLKELGRTQAWLARAVNASEPAVSLWLKGVHNPNLMKIKRIAELLELSFAELVEEDDAICQDRHELAILRDLRALPEDRRLQIGEFIASYTRGTQAAAASPAPSLPPPPDEEKKS